MPRLSNASLAFLGFIVAAVAPTAADERKPLPGGQLRILPAPGEPAGGAATCPLKHTDVQADIVGFVGRVTVTQTFYNPLERKIEAIYVFPLPQDAAVDDMSMTVGDRRIVGQVKPRDEAREVYENAKAAGHVASLLDQERPNIFTQSVANIEPGVTVTIEISYVETLKYDEGVFEWVFPMVVGPRYIPGGGTPTAALTKGTPTAQVPDADKITPPITPEGTRSGHDIGLKVTIDAGMPLHDLASTLHVINVVTPSPNQAVVTLKSESEVPNKDFILRYRLATDEIGDGVLVDSDARGSFITLVLQPPRRIVPADIVPRELIFVLDTSGSMSGFPIEKAKLVMSKAIDALQPFDTFNLITFSGDTHILWDAPRPKSTKNVDEAQKFLASRSGGGGTEMMKAVNAALMQPSPSARSTRVQAPIRVVCFMTDGYVGNDMEIIDAVKKNAATTRVFSFGIGNSVNRFLLDGMAAAGRGEVEYVTIDRGGADAAAADAAVERFHERILAPVLTDVSIDWGTLPVADVFPKQIPDLFSAKPVMVHARLTGPAAGSITLRGITGGGPFARTVVVNAPLPAAGSADGGSALASLWARANVADLMMQDMKALQAGNFPDALKKQMTALGVEFRLMTQFTSFVAVETMRVTIAGEATTIDVPVEMPDGVSYAGIFGESLDKFSDSFAGRGIATGGGGRGLGGVSLKSVARKEAGARVPVAPGKPAGVAAPAVGVTWHNIAADEDDMEAAGEAGATSPESKLADGLRGIAEKVTKEGKDGNFALGKIKVVDFRVDVVVQLVDLSPKTLESLKKLGFVTTGESNATLLLIGTIDVRKLEDLLKLDAVRRVSPAAR